MEAQRRQVEGIPFAGVIYAQQRVVTIGECAAAYQRFCEKYKPKPKPERRHYWGSKLLAQIKARSKVKKKASPGQQSLWNDWETPAAEIRAVAKAFVLANCYDPDQASLRFEPL